MFLPPPVFNLTKPPEPLLDIGQVLEITQQLLDIKSNKCLERKRVEANNDQNYIYSIYIIIFFIILFFILTIILIRYVATAYFKYKIYLFICYLFRKIQKLMKTEVSLEQTTTTSSTSTDDELHKYFECYEKQQTTISTLSRNNSYISIKIDDPFYLTYDSNESQNDVKMWKLDNGSIFRFQKI